MAQVWLTAAVVGLLCCLSPLNACQWDPNTDLNQGLDVDSFNHGVPHLTDLSQISDAEECQRACCERDDCQLALIGTPADGRPQCHLVNCMKDGQDECVLSPSTQFQVYRKIQDTAEQQPQNEAEVRAVNTTDHCRLQFSVGNCRAAFPRFFYNVTAQTCQQFIYGGCGGNNNNFDSQADCEASCAGVTGEMLVDTHSVAQRSRMSVPGDKDFEPKALPEMTIDDFQEKCLAPPESGPCRASIRSYYYKNGTCESFTYGGCRGNQNKYETKESCMAACTVKVIPRSQKTPAASSSLNSFEEACALPSDSGPCRAALRKYFFETSSQSCVPFIYGGCRGNLNRYDSEEECMSACSGNGFGHQKRNRWTPAFFLVATLAIMSALLLVGLILIAVRRNSHLRHLVLDDKEELLPTEEQVSYEKLPKEASS